MQVNILVRQIENMHSRVMQLYQNSHDLTISDSLLPTAFKELGVVSEELQVALEEIYQQQDELLSSHQTLEQERQSYQELMEFIPDGYVVTNPEGIIREANSVAAQLLNLPQRFLIGKPLSFFMGEDERRNFRSNLNQLSQVGKTLEWSTRLQPRNSKTLKVTLKVAPVYDWEGRLVSMRWLICYTPEIHQTEALSSDINNVDRTLYPLQTYTKGELISLNPSMIYQVYQGLVKLSTFSEKGEEVIVGLVGSSVPFGSCLTSLPVYQATALSDVQLVSYTAAEIADSPRLSQSVLGQIKQRLRQTEALLAISGCRRVKDRLYRFLQLLKQEIGCSTPEGTRLNVRLTHEDLANACCTTRVTVTRLLNQLQQQGKISFDPQHHIVLGNDF